MISYFEDQLVDAKQHAIDVFPEESVGVIDNGVYHRLENKAEDKFNTFVIDMREYIKYSNVQCIIHSHDDFPHASRDDQLSQQEIDKPFGIINLVNGSVKDVFFWGDSLPIQDLHGRPFYQGVYDCYALARDYYRIKGLTLPYGVRDFMFWEQGEDIIMENIPRIPFYEVSPDTATEHDLILYSISGKYIDHCAVILKHGWVLHHLVYQLSGTKPITYLQQCIAKVYRYEGEKNGW
jgi:hypothetical protein